MPDIAKAQNYLNEENSQAFLVEYLSLQEAGYNVPIPSSLDLAGICDGWKQIFEQSFSAYPSSGFIEEVATIWLNAVTKQGGNVTETFATELINILTGRTSAPKAVARPQPEVKPKMAAGPQLKPSGTAGGKPAPQAEESAGQSSHYRSSPAEDDVVSHISEDYRSVQSLKNSALLTKDELQIQCEKALENNNEIEFLLNYLSFIRHQEIPEVPLELSHAAIKVRWEHIINNRFHYYSEDSFYEKITDQWVNLVHNAGPLISNDAYYKILEKLEILAVKKSNGKNAVGKQAQPTKQSTAKKKPTFFDKLKNLFS